MQLFRYPKEKKTYLDVVKLLAIGMVVFNHSGNNGYKMYLDVLEGSAHHLIMFFSAFIKIAVPLFFMASGALLLKKEEPYGKILVRRVLRFAAILIVVSLFFYYEAYRKNGAFSLRDFLIHLYRNDLTGHLWYLYSYLCYMLMLPFLRKLAKLMKRQDYIMLMAAYLIMQLLPAADYALFQGAGAHTPYLNFFVAADYVVYPLLGYYIDSIPEEDDREETIYILVFLSIVSLFLTCVLMEWRCGLDGGWTGANREAYMGRLSLFPAITVFYGMKRLMANRPVKEWLSRALFVLGGCTFGVYLFDPKWRQFTQTVRTLLTPFLGLYFATHVQTVCACLLGLAATFIFKCATGGVGLLFHRICPPRETDKLP